MLTREEDWEGKLVLGIGGKLGGMKERRGRRGEGERGFVGYVGN
jgi:hypothetical protein